jgi:hypothetical protein
VGMYWRGGSRREEGFESVNGDSVSRGGQLECEVGGRTGKDSEGAIIKWCERWGVSITAYQNLRCSEKWRRWEMLEVGLR